MSCLSLSAGISLVLCPLVVMFLLYLPFVHQKISDIFYVHGNGRLTRSLIHPYVQYLSWRWHMRAYGDQPDVVKGIV